MTNFQQYLAFTSEIVRAISSSSDRAMNQPVQVNDQHGKPLGFFVAQVESEASRLMERDGVEYLGTIEHEGARYALFHV